MSKHIKIFEQEVADLVEMHEQELIELERWIKDNFHTIPYIVQLMIVRGQRATEKRIEQLKEGSE